jgi:hypothetical protein
MEGESRYEQVEANDSDVIDTREINRAQGGAKILTEHLGAPCFYT